MSNTEISVQARLDDAKERYRNRRCDVFPRTKATIVSIATAGAVLAPSDGWKLAFGAIAGVFAASAVAGYYAKDSFGISDAGLMQSASDNLRDAVNAQKSDGSRSGQTSPPVAQEFTPQ